MSVEGIFKGITRAKKEGNSIEGTGGHKEGKTRNCNLPFHWQYGNTKWGLSADDDENEWKNDWEQNILDQHYLTFNLYFLV